MSYRDLQLLNIRKIQCRSHCIFSTILLLSEAQGCLLCDNRTSCQKTLSQRNPVRLPTLKVYFRRGSLMISARSQVELILLL